jgi:Phage tail protein (Tail_P2_I)
VSTYERWQSEDLAPPWLQRRFGAAWMRVHGRAKDLLVDATRQAIKARFVGLCPADALEYIGRDRLLERYPVDTDDSYRARLAAAWEAWLFGGTERGVRAALEAAGFGSVTIYTTQSPGYPPDADAANWSRFWVELAPPFPPYVAWEAVLFGAAPTGSGQLFGAGWTWGSTATVADVSFVRSIIRKWKPAHAVCAQILVKLPKSGGGFHTVRWPGME